MANATVGDRPQIEEEDDSDEERQRLNDNGKQLRKALRKRGERDDIFGSDDEVSFLPRSRLVLIRRTPSLMRKVRSLKKAWRRRRKRNRCQVQRNALLDRHRNRVSRNVGRPHLRIVGHTLRQKTKPRQHLQEPVQRFSHSVPLPAFRRHATSVQHHRTRHRDEVTLPMAARAEAAVP